MTHPCHVRARLPTARHGERAVGINTKGPDKPDERKDHLRLRIIARRAEARRKRLTGLNRSATKTRPLPARARPTASRQEQSKWRHSNYTPHHLLLILIVGARSPMRQATPARCRQRNPSGRRTRAIPRPSHHPRKSEADWDQASALARARRRSRRPPLRRERESGRQRGRRELCRAPAPTSRQPGRRSLCAARRPHASSPSHSRHAPRGPLACLESPVPRVSSPRGSLGAPIAR
jgi:hypothetical protein